MVKKIIDTGGNHQRLQTIARCAVTGPVTIIDTGGNHQRRQTIARCAVTGPVTIIDAVVATISFCRLLNSGNHGLLYCRLLTKIVHAK